MLQIHEILRYLQAPPLTTDTIKETTRLL